MSKVILVTGGTGLVGKAIESVVTADAASYADYSFIFIGSKDGDLSIYEDTDKLFQRYKPYGVIHLAALVGGLFKNMSRNLDFFRTNCSINDNVLRCCHLHDVKKVVSCLSTCIFPDAVTYPIDETMLHLGPPHASNFGYSYAKRMIDVLNQGYSDVFKRTIADQEKRPVFTSVIPTNIYGPHDNYNLDDGHVIPSLIHKCYLKVQEALTNGQDQVILDVFGSGKPMRQFIYSHDLATLMLWTLINYQESSPLILSVSEADEISIQEAAQSVADAFGDVYNINITLKNDTTKQDGQFKKTACNSKLLRLREGTTFTSFKDGIKDTVQWFKTNYDSARK